jgi:FtsP/CotA-like multicopper oxidase with cupredoxin domain
MKILRGEQMKKLIPIFLVGMVFSGFLGAEGLSPEKDAALKRLRQRMTNPQRQAAALRAAAARQRDLKLNGSLQAMPAPGGAPNYFGPEPNFANSPLLAKFVDSLPGLNTPNNLGQMIPVAVPDTLTFPGSDYYEIALQEYFEKMHSQLAPTRLRGYVQLNRGTANGANTVNPAPVHYLGPMIVAQHGRPVRIKFTNLLPTGSGGDLFIPTDITAMGAGMGPIDGMMYTQNRANLHLHGGDNPWISDGTPHQWITPAGENTPYPRGVSARNVPDMFFDAAGNVVSAGTPGATNDPGPGSQTYYYPNGSSARLMFYHDHAYGITRLNVYAGAAAGYMLTDTAENVLINGGNLGGQTITAGAIPSTQIPLIIQDKTFVNPGKIVEQDPTWSWGGAGQLWFPHVYMPNQNPADLGGSNAMGRWDYGPWFWPPVTFLTHMPIYVGNGVYKPGVPDVSMVPEAFMDTPLVNGTAYPYVKVQRKAYRFRILNACNDRFLNLQLYYADPNYKMGTRPNAPGLPGFGTEVKMVPSAPNSAFPANWPTDGRDGGVPDPETAGPPFIQIGTEGGFLPNPVVIPSQPVGYEYDRRSITVLNVADHALYLGPAERADVIVDFSNVPAGARIILYNDAPAPVPAFDSRYDYYTDDPDNTATGGAPSTFPGYGPNTRTIMQIQVEGDSSGTAFSLDNLKKALPVAFKQTQSPPIVPLGQYVRIADTSINIIPPGGSAPVTIPLLPKALHELFELEYGRMNALMAVELPLTNFTTQTTIPLGYIDLPTEKLTDNEIQIWKITHNGVDTHAIHFHLFNVQVVNRVGWDGMVKPPDDNELGWKETVKMNPLEDIIVALRPVAPNVPFAVPDSIRLLDVTRPAGVKGNLTQIDPSTGTPWVVTNDLTNFGWEYVWHCHLLGHEENDMMRPMVFRVAPAQVQAVKARLQGHEALVEFTAPEATGGSPVTSYTVIADPGDIRVNGTRSPIRVSGLKDEITYQFRVIAQNEAGISARSLPSNPVRTQDSDAAAAAGRRQK